MAETPSVLHAEDTDTAHSSVTVTPEDQAPPLVAETARTITGRVLPWGEMGRTTNGVLKFQAGAINVPTEISRVKLLAGHSPTGVPVGHATSWETRKDGLYMTFQMGSSAAADDALTAAAEHVIDAFSIEAYGIERTGTTVTASIMSAVALVPMPAFASARVDTVNASAPPPDGDAGGDGDDPDPDDDQTDDDQHDDDGDTADDDTENENEDTVNKKNLRPGVMPGQTSTSTETAHASMAEVADYLCAAVRGDSTTDMLAELTDITDAGTLDRNAPAWLGEVWNGVDYDRRIIPLISSAPLTSRKVRGYRWKTKPRVAAYAGNKAEIPSFPVELEPVERDAERWAGGNDLDRAFWDFGETEFLQAYWRAMAESYAFETDQSAAAFLVANATAVDGGGDNIIDAVIRGSLAVQQGLKTPASFVLINPADYVGILGMTTLDRPAYMDRIPHLDPSSWEPTDFVPSGTVLLGTKNAVTHYELSGSPLRVEAEHIAKGGRDAALFGYTAKMLNRPEGLRSIAFNTTPPVEG